MPVVIAGGSVAALVVTERLLAAGEDVRLHTPARIGSGFLPIEVDGHRIEYGCRLLELDYGDLTGSHRPWMPRIDEYVRSFIKPVDVACDPHWVFSGDLTELPELVRPRHLDMIRQESRLAIERAGPAGQRHGSYRKATLRNTGPTFHRLFIAPLLDKILPEADLPAVEHRRIWLPLFHPRTVHESACGTLTYRPYRPVHLGVGAFVEALAARTAEAATTDPAPASVDLRDTPAEPGPRADIAFAWTLDYQPAGVRWHTDASPVFRSTSDGTVTCWESHEPVDIPGAFHTAHATYPLTTTHGFGQGVLNEQIAQGLAAAERILNGLPHGLRP